MPRLHDGALAHGDRQQLVGLVERARDRLLDEDVLARAGGGDGRLAVQVVGREHIDHVDRGVRQQLLNVRVMLSLRRALFDRLLHLPLPKLWEMKTGGILSRLTGDIDTTTGLLQMAIISPSLSVIRLLIAIGILLGGAVIMVAMIIRARQGAEVNRAAQGEVPGA